MKLAEAKVTSKGQVTIPKKIRAMFNLTSGKSVVFIPEKNEVIMKPKPKNPLDDLLKLREEIRFSEQEIDEMIMESKKEWSKI
jgi:AbrB family looped-hinge helix DNA binding protein